MSSFNVDELNEITQIATASRFIGANDVFVNTELLQEMQVYLLKKFKEKNKEEN